MNDKVKSKNKSIEKWEIKKKRGNLSEAVDAASIRALGSSNRDLQPRKLSNYIRSGYLQVQMICSVILFQFRGDIGVSRDDLYDSVCDVFPATTFANFRKILATGVDSEIFYKRKGS